MMRYSKNSMAGSAVGFDETMPVRARRDETGRARVSDGNQPHKGHPIRPSPVRPVSGGPPGPAPPQLTSRPLSKPTSHNGPAISRWGCVGSGVSGSGPSPEVKTGEAIKSQQRLVAVESSAYYGTAHPSFRRYVRFAPRQPALSTFR